MPEVIQESDLRDNHVEILRRVATDGESFTVTVDGRAVADLVPHRGLHMARAGDVDELLAAAGPGPDPDRWVRDMENADRVFGDDRPGDPGDRGAL